MRRYRCLAACVYPANNLARSVCRCSCPGHRFFSSTTTPKRHAPLSSTSDTTTAACASLDLGNHCAVYNAQGCDRTETIQTMHQRTGGTLRDDDEATVIAGARDVRHLAMQPPLTTRQHVTKLPRRAPRTAFSFWPGPERERSRDSATARTRRCDVARSYPQPHDIVPNNTPAPRLPMWASSLTHLSMSKIRLRANNWICANSDGFVSEEVVRDFLAWLQRPPSKTTQASRTTARRPAAKTSVHRDCICSPEEIVFSGLHLHAPLRRQIQHNINLHLRKSCCRGVYSKRSFRRGDVILCIPLTVCMNTQSIERVFMSSTASDLTIESKIHDSSNASCRTAVVSSPLCEGEVAHDTTTIVRGGSFVGPDAGSEGDVYVGRNIKKAHTYTLCEPGQHSCILSYDDIHSIVECLNSRGESVCGRVAHMNESIIRQMHLACLLATEKSLGLSSRFYPYISVLGGTYHCKAQTPANTVHTRTTGKAHRINSLPNNLSASSFHEYNMFDDDRTRARHRDVLQPGMLMEYDDHVYRFTHYLRAIHITWWRRYKALFHVTSNCKPCVSSDDVSNSASSQDNVACCRRTKIKKDDDVFDTPHRTHKPTTMHTSRYDKNDPSIQSSIELMLPFVTPTHIDNSTSMTRYNTSMRMSVCPTASVSNDSTIIGSETTLAPPPPLLEDLVWAFRAVLSRQRPLPCMSQTLPECNTKSVKSEAKPVSLWTRMQRYSSSWTCNPLTQSIRESQLRCRSDSLIAHRDTSISHNNHVFARVVMHTKLWVYHRLTEFGSVFAAKTTVAQPPGSIISINIDGDSDDTCLKSKAAVTVDQEDANKSTTADAIDGDDQNCDYASPELVSYTATLVPLLDMIQHASNGSPNTVTHVELMPSEEDDEYAERRSDKYMCSPKVHAHEAAASNTLNAAPKITREQNSADKEHVRHSDRSHTEVTYFVTNSHAYPHAMTVASKNTIQNSPDSHDNSSETKHTRPQKRSEKVPHFVVRAAENIDQYDELTTLFPECYSIPYTLYRYNSLPLHRRKR